MKQADIKIANINKVKKLPKEKGTVKATFLRAGDTSRKNSWNKCVMVGKNKEGKYNVHHSDMLWEDVFGLLEAAKIILGKDFLQ